jgi:RimJ/RimL family protein N-acetyltransferase
VAVACAPYPDAIRAAGGTPHSRTSTSTSASFAARSRPQNGVGSRIRPMQTGEARGPSSRPKPRPSASCCDRSSPPTPARSTRFIGSAGPTSPLRSQGRFRRPRDRRTKHGDAGRARLQLLARTRARDRRGGRRLRPDSARATRPEIELTYRLGQRWWGRGLATEAAGAALRAGFDVLGLDCILAVTHPQNAGSRRVIEKLGMTYRGMGTHYGGCVVYALARAGARPASRPHSH